MLSWEQHPKCLEGLPKLFKTCDCLFHVRSEEARKPGVLSWDQHPKCLEGLPKLFWKHVISFFMCILQRMC